MSAGGGHHGKGKDTIQLLPFTTQCASFIDPVALLVWDLHRSQQTVTKGYLWREENMEGFAEMTMIMMSTKYAPSLGLWGILSTHPGDDQAHLQWTMFGAGAWTSKHQLLLAAWVAEQAKWSGVNMGTYAMDNKGTTWSTSSHTPSASVV
ncbi:hypothetical protein F5141DRAFT_1225960 [Pisolithus sp. B1]|nr:hypothetical protein F5141DRAFT_1225960 [Pisolithus sp. B1]